MLPPGIPCLDISGFLDGSHPIEVARQFDLALREIGFLLILGHGISERLISAVYREAIAFFELPIGEKQQLMLADRSINRGYIPMGRDSVAGTRGQSAPPDLCEALMYYRLACEAGDHPWPRRPVGFRPALMAYNQALMDLTGTLMRISALALGLPEAYFTPYLDPCGGVIRLVHYPEQEQEPLPGQLRYGAHSDYGGLTLLWQDEAPGGLQVCLPSGEWVDVPPIPGSFVVNVGDLIACWTNDRWRSTLHRVVNPPRTALGRSRRLALVYFTGIRDEALIECLPTCHSPSHPPRYQPVRAGDYIQAKINASIAQSLPS
ncbi:MAG: 2OG-Fe(II) oxygenase family protein [Thermostichales cyanobacterium BF4_bins_65]